MDFVQEANGLFEFTRHLRRDFHRNPELGFQEVRTAGVVARELNELGLEVTTGVGQTGVVAVLEGQRPGPVVLARFDMDALPILEKTGAEYSSQNPGVMHACGHDGHTAIGISVAKLLAEHRHELAGTVKFVFQPAEEGMGGAEAMIIDGALENPKPDYALGLHLWNDKPVGWVGVADGPMMAAAEKFRIEIHGKGGHGAAPHQSIDPIVAAAQIVTGLQSIVARNVPPLDTAVISVTTIHGGETFNVIPPMVEMEGTIRTFQAGTRQQVLDRFHQAVNGIAESMGCSATIECESLTPAVNNHPEVAEIVRQTASRVLPTFSLQSQFATMGSEDMAFFLEKTPGCFFFIGSANEDRGLNWPHHHPRFDVDESVLPSAVALMSSSIVALSER